ncbi:ABC transporter permease [Microbacterium sp. NPDC089190]|uniref:ABC transporter permease n=1 Tax=Microbacterium sp. NPDC089190 TaxID=3155063 RepID=UPI00344C0F0C
MTAVTTAPAASRAPSSARRRARSVLSWVLLGFALLLIAQWVCDAPGLSSSSTWGSALRLTVPIAVVAVGALYSERAGVINVGLEGMMIGGTWGAGLFGWFGGPWVALIGGVVGGLVFGLLMAVLCLELGLNQLVVGVAINVLAAALARFLSDIVFSGLDGGNVARSPRIEGNVPRVSLPFLSGGFGTPDPLRDLEATGIPVLSPLAGIVGGLTRDVSLAAIIGLALIPLTAFVLWRTRFGLRMRASGEEPAALQALGGHVHRTRYLAVLVGSGMAGFAGGYLVLISQGYVENQVAGRGFIGLATLIFGNWMPGGVFAGSALFGFSDAVGLGRPETFRGMLFVLGAVFVVLGAVRLRRRLGVRAAVPSLILGAVLLVAALVLPLPSALATAAPYLVTLAVLVVAGTRMRPPRALGRFFPRQNSSR